MQSLYPCRCTGNVDVIADHTARMLAEAKAHMTNIPQGNTPWPSSPVRPLARTVAEQDALDRERLSLWFGLSYASWLTMPRVLMEAMPARWQGQMAALLEEWDRTWNTEEYPGTTVRASRSGRLVPMDPRLLSYRHPDHEWIESLRRGPMTLDDGTPIPCGHSDFARGCVHCGEARKAVYAKVGIKPTEEPWSL